MFRFITTLKHGSDVWLAKSQYQISVSCPAKSSLSYITLRKQNLISDSFLHPDSLELRSLKHSSSIIIQLEQLSHVMYVPDRKQGLALVWALVFRSLSLQRPALAGGTIG